MAHQPRDLFNQKKRGNLLIGIVKWGWRHKRISGVIIVVLAIIAFGLANAPASKTVAPTPTATAPIVAQAVATSTVKAVPSSTQPPVATAKPIPTATIDRARVEAARQHARATEAARVEATIAAKPSATPKPSNTVPPTKTVIPTQTAVPSSTPTPKNTDTPEPTATPAPTEIPYSVVIKGGMPPNEYVGQQVQLHFTVTNTGHHIRYLVIQFDGLDHWVVNDSFSNNGLVNRSLEPSPTYSFGPVNQGQVVDITLVLTPKDAGNQRLSIATYHNFDQTLGTIDSTSSIDNGGSGGWQIAINP